MLSATTTRKVNKIKQTFNVLFLNLESQDLDPLFETLGAFGAPNNASETSDSTEEP
jgi:hypothetical protein